MFAANTDHLLYIYLLTEKTFRAKLHKIAPCVKFAVLVLPGPCNSNLKHHRICFFGTASQYLSLYYPRTCLDFKMKQRFLEVAH